MNLCVTKARRITELVLSIFFAAVCARAQAQPQPVKPYLRIETGAHTAIVRSIATDAAGRFLVSASEDKTARVWDLRSGKLLKILRPPIGEFDEGKLYAAAISPDGTTIALGGFTGADGSPHSVYVFDRESDAIRKTIPGLPNAILYLAYSKDGRYLAASLGGKNGIRIFETRGYSEVARDTDYSDSTYGLEFDGSGRLATASWDGFVRLYSSQFRLLHKARPPGGKRPFSGRFSPDGKRLAVGLSDVGEVDILSGDNLSFQHSLQAPTPEGSLIVASWSTDGHTVCAAGEYRNSELTHPILCWGEQGKGRPRSLPAAGNTILDLRILSDGEIVFCAFDSSVGVLNRNGNILWRARSSAPDFKFLSSVPRLSPDGNTVEIATSYLNETSWAQHSLRFSVAERRLESDAKPNPSLLPATTDGLNIEGWLDGKHPTFNGHALELDLNETSTSLAISPRKNSFVLGTEWNLRKFDGEGKPLWYTSVQSPAWSVNISRDERYIVAALADGTIRWYTFTEGKEILALFVDRDLRGWVACNPDGFFTFDNGGDALIGYQLNRGPDQAGDFIKVDQLRDVFYRPDLIAQILKPGGTDAVTVARSRIGDISKILSSGLPPQIELLSEAQAEVDDAYLLRFRVKDMGGGHGRLVYRLDGAQIEGVEGRGAADIRGNADDAIDRRVSVGSGSHTLTVSVYNASNTIEGEPKAIFLRGRQVGPRSNLFLVAAGISHYSDPELNHGVKFAAADADLIMARFQEQEGKGLYPKVKGVSLTDSRATIQNLERAITDVSKAIQPGDTFVLYLAGHGVAADGEYYFIPWEAADANPKDLLKKSLSREAILTLLRKIPTSKSVLILDTCSAGAFLGKSDPLTENAAIERVGMTLGRVVLGAANAEAALEGYQNHGVFTYTLIEGMKAADSDPQGDILITRLGEYAKKWVPEITSQKWHYRQDPVTVFVGPLFPIVHKLPD